MASKGPRSKIDHDSRSKRQKALEPSKEPRRPKTHWDYVLEEMMWLSKDFESERKFKLALAKKVASRATRGMMDQATRGERKVKEEELRLKKVALNISKDVKKFWTKIEKLVLYKHQLEVDAKKKKVQDKQLEFLLGQTERYSTMLAENLVDSPLPVLPTHSYSAQEQFNSQLMNTNDATNKSSEALPNSLEDEDYDVLPEDESVDDELTIEEDEALITEEERKEELAALQNEVDMPLEELLKRYGVNEVSRESTPVKDNGVAEINQAGADDSHSKDSSVALPGRRSVKSNGCLSVSEIQNSEVDGYQIMNHSKGFKMQEKMQLIYDFNDENEDGDFIVANGEEKDDETTLVEEEELAIAESDDTTNEVALLQKESELPLEELLASYKKNSDSNEDSENDSGSEYTSPSEDFFDSPTNKDADVRLQHVSKDASHGPAELLPAVSSPIREQVEEPNQVSEVGEERESIIADAAAAARSAQPTGNTFLTTKVRTKVPFLLKFSLREYQHIGLDWLVTMYEKKLNGILADEMGLGKTIMTIALLAHLACEKGIWGPHLIVVPTSVMLNWETEFLKWCPAFKILTYFGSAKERKLKRQGWMKPNSFHVCVTTYRLVIQDSKAFKRKKWKYLILDEAHLIKNWKSQRWQTLLNFNAKRRILLTGTPLQNDLMELWSLMHFLMPHIFQSHQEFKDWFSNPISGMVEGQEKVNKEVIDRLHNVLRPFILRRLKRDVEKQLPMKHEHVIFCRLSRRQRNLYEDFIASSETQATLANANFFGMISVIMQLRKVCNHPDLFEGRPIISSFDMKGIDIQLSSAVCSVLTSSPFSSVDLVDLGFLFTHLDFSMTSWESDEVQAISTPSILIEGSAIHSLQENGRGINSKRKLQGFNIFEEIQKALLEERLKEAKERAASIAWWNSLRCKRKPVYSTTLRELVSVRHPVEDTLCGRNKILSYLNSSILSDIVFSPLDRFERMVDQVESFMFAIPGARAPPPSCWCSKTGTPAFLNQSYKEKCSELLSPLLTPIRPAIVRRQVYFPDRRLIQFDCGKLQELAVLLRRLKTEGHRALIFTQMTKMLDVLEAFINLYGYTYMRLDGSTQPEERQTLMQRFNTNPKYFLFILSTRSGGVGINLVGADTVIFYDSDWNPAMDQQAQDRCHRIGQTREVHIYRLISESTIEENILKKAKQKRALDDLVIQSGSYNTEFFKKLDPLELFSGHRTISLNNKEKEKTCTDGAEGSVSNADVEAALKYAEDEADYMALKKVEQEEAVDNQEFTEEIIGKMEDDEFANEEGMKAEDAAGRIRLKIASIEENGPIVNEFDPNGERAITSAGVEDDIDALDDVKQMAEAAAAAGQAILSFENQLRPIDRYAIRFLESWDPIVDKAAIESQVRFEEAEWELDHIEKLKEDMEADNDDDDEPIVYERWDSEFATKVYREQVEALAQHQLMEELELEARENERAHSEALKSDSLVLHKPKPKKKPKKAKFKSLKKGSLAHESKPTDTESLLETMSLDDEIVSDEMITSSNTASVESNMLKKRKAGADASELKIAKKSKKLSDTPEICSLNLASNSFVKLRDEPKNSKFVGVVHDPEQKSIGKIRLGVKISTTSMPSKRVLTIKPEKLRKKGSLFSKDCFPAPDTWLPSEDAILSAVVHEYGPHWSLVSDILYGITAGGFYRGVFRHPAHCCERYRELLQRYVLSAVDNLHNEKSSSVCSGKSLLKVTEDHVRMLLDVASEIPDNDLTLQKHFFALLSSAWRYEQRQKIQSSQRGRFLTSIGNHSLRDPIQTEPMPRKFSNLSQCGKIVAAALNNASSIRHDERASIFSNREESQAITGQLGITMEIPADPKDQMVLLPPVVNLSISSYETSPSVDMSTGKNHHIRSSLVLSENRFREASKACVEDSLGWASSAFQLRGAKPQTPLKFQSSAKHKMPLSESVLRPLKSKQRKTMVDHIDSLSVRLEPEYRMVPRIPNDLRPNYDMTSSSVLGVGMDHFASTSYLDLDEIASETQSHGTLPHDYVPDFIAGLDDCSNLPEFTDIG